MGAADFGSQLRVLLMWAAGSFFALSFIFVYHASPPRWGCLRSCGLRVINMHALCSICSLSLLLGTWMICIQSGLQVNEGMEKHLNGQPPSLPAPSSENGESLTSHVLKAPIIDQWDSGACLNVVTWGPLFPEANF